MSEALNVIAELVTDPDWCVALRYEENESTRYVRYLPDEYEFEALNSTSGFVGERHPINHDVLVEKIEQSTDRHWFSREYMTHAVANPDDRPEGEV